MPRVLDLVEDVVLLTWAVMGRDGPQRATTGHRPGTIPQGHCASQVEPRCLGRRTVKLPIRMPWFRAPTDRLQKSNSRFGAPHSFSKNGVNTKLAPFDPSADELQVVNQVAVAELVLDYDLIT